MAEININNELTFRNIEEFHKEISGKLKKNKEIIINLNNIDSIDITGIQLLKSLTNINNIKVILNTDIDNTTLLLLQKCDLVKVLNNK